MTVRHKITLLITAAGFISSLLFSCIIMLGMLKQHLRLIDTDLEGIIMRAARFASRIDDEKDSEAPCLIGDEHYWLEIKDQDSGKLIYRSNIARRIKIPEPPPDSNATVELIIPPELINLGQDRKNEVIFRVRNSRISLDARRMTVCAGRPIESLEEEIFRTIGGVAAGLFFSVLLLMAISYFLAGFILKPIRVMNQQAVDITAKHLHRRLPISDGRDEFNALAQTLNQVFDRLQHAFIQQKKLLADASHELKTPLTMMRLALDKIRSGLDETHLDPHTESHERMTEQVLRMERLVRGLLDLSTLEMASVAAQNPIDVTKILTSLIADYQPMGELRNFRIEVDLPQRLKIEGDEEKLYRAFSNIMDNAVKYSTDGGQIEITCVQSSSDIAITISNIGPVVPQTEIPKVFDQFYRVEQSRSSRHGGSGLGLSIVKRIVELHGGGVKFESRTDNWTHVTVTLPRHRAQVVI